MLVNSLFIGSVVFCTLLGPVLVLWYRSTQLRIRRLEILRLMDETVLERYRDTFCVAEPEREDSNGPDKHQIVDGLFHRAHSRGEYVLAMTLLVIPTGFGLSVCALWLHDNLYSIHSHVAGIHAPIILAFLGGYVWSLYELLARIHTGDLTARSLTDIAYRVIASVPVGYAFSLLAGDGLPGFFAFAASAFPLRDIRRWLRRLALQKLQQQPVSASSEAATDSLGHTIVGLSDETLARLEEIHISTNLDMAYLDPLLLYAETGVPVRCAIDWMDQAIWSLYVGKAIRKLAPMGLRSAIEASNLYQEVCLDEEDEPRPRADWVNAPKIQGLSKALGDLYTPDLVVKMLDEVYGDPHVELLSALWHETSGEEA